MANESFAVRLETPWEEPLGLAEPTDEQWSSGVVVRMLDCLSGPERNLQVREFYLVNPDEAERLVEAGYARYETERETRIAKAEGHRRTRPGVKAPAAKSKGKAKDAPKGG